MAREQSQSDVRSRYVTRLASEWDHHSAFRFREITGTLVYVDISGFTALSERLARRGRIGAEELTDVLNHVFAGMLSVAYDRGGSLLKFGGDALLLLFHRDNHAMQACSAVVEMQRVLRESADYRTSAGKLRLKMSVGVHSGTVQLFLVGESHHELIVTGPGASTTTRMEETAEAGEIVVSEATRSQLPAGSAVRPKGEGWLLRWRTPRIEGDGFIPRQPTSAEQLLMATPLALREVLSQGTVEPQHHIATVGFLKFTGVDTLIRQRGLSATSEVIHHLISHVQQVVDDEGVTFLATDIDEDGGKIIVVAGVPGVQEDDGGRVLRASRRVIDGFDGPLDLQIGVNNGHVFVADIGSDFRATFTIMGDTVNIAARLMSAASADSVYSNAASLDASRTIFETTELEPFTVKGKAHPVEAFAVGARTGSRPRRHGGELPFVGRTAELEILRKRIEALKAGQGGTLAIIGERGVGKSRLIDELRPDLEGVLHIEIRAEPYGTVTPYRPLRDPVRTLLGIRRADPKRMASVLRRRVARISPESLPYLPLLGDVTMIPVESTPEVDLIDPQFRQARTADVVADLLASAFDGPVLFEVEDGHFMDEASAHGMLRIAEATSDHPWFVVTTRPAGDDGFHPGQDELALGPLSDEDAHTLVQVATEGTPLRPHEASTVVKRSAGLPLFLEEILRSLHTAGGIEAMPDSLEALVSSQIDGLQPLTRRSLQYASVLGTSFRVETFNELVEPENLELDAATRRALQEFIESDGPGRVRFRHALIRDAAYQGLSFKRRRELHRRAAEAAEAAAAPDPEAVADQLALHFSQANDYVRAWRYARVAGDQAAASYANVDAAVHYRRSLDAMRRVGSVNAPEQAAVWAALGDVSERAGLFDEALASYQRASRLLSKDPSQQAAVLLKRALVRRRSGAYRAALGELTKASKLAAKLAEDDATRVSGRVAAERAAIRRWQQRPADVLKLAEQAGSCARQCNDLETLGQALDLVHWAHLMMGHSDHEAPYEETLEIYETLADLSAVANVWNNRGADAFMGGRWHEAIEAYSRSSDAEQRCGNDVGAAISSANVAEVLINQRRFEEAEPVLEAALRVLKASGHAPAVAFAEAELARLWLRRGDHERAEPALIDLRDRSVQAGEVFNVVNAALLLAELRIAAGDGNHAQQLLDAVRIEGGDLVDYFGPAFARIESLIAAERGTSADALSRLDESLARARAQNQIFDQAVLLETRCLIAERFGVDPSADDMNEVGRLFAELGIQPEPTIVG